MGEATMLTMREIVPYMLERGLIRNESIIDGDLMIVDVSRRNRNFKLISAHGPSYLIKQGIEADGIATVSHEASVYQFLQSHRKGLHSFLPRFYAYDSEEHVLVIECLRDAHNLREYYTRRGRCSIAVAKTLADALSKLHGLTGFESKDEDISRQQEPAWILSVHRPGLRDLKKISGANLQIINIIQQSGEFCEHLDELRREWRSETLTHYDIKLNNCIISSSTDRKSKLKIVDWELAGLGDPCWDVGSVFNDYLSFWLRSIPTTGESQPSLHPELARYPLNTMRPAIRSFWQTYAKKMKLDVDKHDEWLVRSAKYTAARLVQSAFEQMQASIRLTGNVVCSLQLSENILKKSQQSIVKLLGIPLERKGSI